MQSSPFLHLIKEGKKLAGSCPHQRQKTAHRFSSSCNTLNHLSMKAMEALNSTDWEERIQTDTLKMVACYHFPAAPSKSARKSWYLHSAICLMFTLGQDLDCTELNKHLCEYICNTKPGGELESGKGTWWHPGAVAVICLIIWICTIKGQPPLFLVTGFKTVKDVECSYY